MNQADYEAKKHALLDDIQAVLEKINHLHQASNRLEKAVIEDTQDNESSIKSAYHKFKGLFHSEK